MENIFKLFRIVYYKTREIKRSRFICADVFTRFSEHLCKRNENFPLYKRKADMFSYNFQELDIVGKLLEIVFVSLLFLMFQTLTRTTWRWTAVKIDLIRSSTREENQEKQQNNVLGAHVWNMSDIVDVIIFFWTQWSGKFSVIDDELLLLWGVHYVSCKSN